MVVVVSIECFDPIQNEPRDKRRGCKRTVDLINGHIILCPVLSSKLDQLLQWNTDESCDVHYEVAFLGLHIAPQRIFALGVLAQVMCSTSQLSHERYAGTHQRCITNHSLSLPWI